MSAFIVSDSTITRIVEFCYGLQFKREAPLCYLKSPEYLAGHEQCEEFGQRLYAMNVAAVAQRYGNADDMMPDGGYVYRPDLSDANVYQVLKSLDCYLYQCSEGDVPNRPLFVALDTLRTDLCRILATHTPQYESAEWG